jgi:hypothetical protein
MPSETEMLENVLVRARDRKSSKKYRGDRCCAPKHEPKPCEVECCIPDCNPDCCTAAFQRLDKLRNYWLLAQYGLATSGTALALTIPATVYNRAGSSVTVPVYDTLTPGQQGEGGNTWGTNERQAFAFVNTVRYLNYEECGKLDQVNGWSVDLQTGDLYFYQNLPDLGLSTDDSRAYLLNTTPTNLTPYDKRKLQEIEPFWKLSLKAVERVRENPKTEGNICEIKDKCGNRFLVAVNRADGQITQTGAITFSGNSVCDYNSQYSIVVVKLC